MNNMHTALITGASSGIGASFAHELAAKGTNLIVVARSEEKLLNLAEDLKAKHNILVDVIVADLNDEDTAKMIYNRVKELDREVDLLINNAGVSLYGLFNSLDLSKQQDVIKLNVLSVISLTHLFLEDMILRNKGSIINVASTAAFQPIPYMALYSGTKSFILNWSEALSAETKEKGISVVTVCPGSTDTNIFKVMGTDDVGIGNRRTPIQVVRTALRALEKKRMTVVDGKINLLGSQIYRFLPRKLVANLSLKMFKPS